jgi:hypothetical protein
MSIVLTQEELAIAVREYVAKHRSGMLEGTVDLKWIVDGRSISVKLTQVSV